MDVQVISLIALSLGLQKSVKLLPTVFLCSQLCCLLQKAFDGKAVSTQEGPMKSGHMLSKVPGSEHSRIGVEHI